MRPRSTTLRQSQIRAAFTLIELLVVIAVISVLAAMLLPALSRARQSVYQVDCANRQRQWAQEFISYPDDHEGLIPREGWDGSGEVLIHNWSQVAGFPLATGGRDTDETWFNALPPKLGLRPTYDYAHPSLRAQFYDRRNLIQCPSARFPRDVDRFSYQLAIFSLSMNSHLIRSGEGPAIAFSSIVDYGSSKMVLFLDNLLEGEKRVHLAQSQNNLGQPASTADRFSARHRNGGNLAFADGHVYWYPGNKVVETDNTNPLRGGPILPATDIVWELPYH